MRTNDVHRHICSALLALAAWLALSACASDAATRNGNQESALTRDVAQTPFTTATSTPSPTSTSTPTSTPTPTPSITPTLGPSPTPTLPPPTPPLSESGLEDDFFFAESLVPGCELPCWQGLVVGQSGRDEIQAMFDTVFHFDGTREFIPEGAQGSTVPGLTGLLATGNTWHLNSQLEQEFGVVTWVDEETYTLRALVLYSSHYRPFIAQMTPRRILQELGEPDYFMASIGLTERGDVGILHLLIVYKEGMGFPFSVFTPIAITFEDDDTQGILELCLDGPRWNGDHELTGTRYIYIMEPFTHGLENLTRMQALEVGDIIEGQSLIPLEDFFDTSMEEVMQLASQEGDACLYKDIFAD